MVKLGQWLQKAVAKAESHSSPLPFFPLQLPTSLWAFLGLLHTPQVPWEPAALAAGPTSGASQERVLLLRGAAPRWSCHSFCASGSSKPVTLCLKAPSAFFGRAAP